jgi:hypothetical protein
VPDISTPDVDLDLLNGEFETEILQDQNDQQFGLMKSNIVESADALPEEYRPQLRQLLNEFHDIFRCGLTVDPPVDIAPLSIQLVDGAQPLRCRQRHYAQSYYLPHGYFQAVEWIWFYIQE